MSLMRRPSGLMDQKRVSPVRVPRRNVTDDELVSIAHEALQGLPRHPLYVDGYLPGSTTRGVDARDMERAGAPHDEITLHLAIGRSGLREREL